MADLASFSLLQEKVLKYKSDYNLTSLITAFHYLVVDAILGPDNRNLQDTITEGSMDRGIDAVYIEERTIHIFNTKFILEFDHTNKRFSENDAFNLITIVDAIFSKNVEHSDVNEILWEKINEIWGVLNRPNRDSLTFKIHLCSNAQKLNARAQKRFERVLAKYRIIEVYYYDQVDIANKILERERLGSDYSHKKIFTKTLSTDLVRRVKKTNDSKKSINDAFDENIRLSQVSSSTDQRVYPADLLTTANRKLKVFLCHSKNDKSKVRDLYSRLVVNGIDAWLDEEKLLPGQDWDLEIRKSVRDADVVIVFISKNSITTAGYIQKEIRFALDVADEQPEGSIFIIPARLEDCQVPSRLNQWHWVNLFEDIGFKKLMQSLISRAMDRGTFIPFAVQGPSSNDFVPLLKHLNWSALPKKLISILKSIKGASVAPVENDYLHLTIVSIESSSAINKEDPNIPDWLTSDIVETTRTFFSRNALGNPEIYLHNDSLSIPQAKGFACVIPLLNITDERDHETRNNLRKLLSSIKLSPTFDRSLIIEVHVVPMHFRYKDLLARVDEENDTRKINIIVDDLISEIEDALAVAPLVGRAHQHEYNRVLVGALEQYLEAYYLAPTNRYIQRHIAEAYLAIGDLTNSARWWEKILLQEEKSSYYLSYAYVLTRMGNNSKANECFQKAHSFAQENSKILVEWGDFLMAENNAYDAIKKYEAAIKLTLEVDDRDRIWLRLAEVNFEMGNVDIALSFTKLVLDRVPDNNDARRLIVKILKKTDR